VRERILRFQVERENTFRFSSSKWNARIDLDSQVPGGTRE